MNQRCMIEPEYVVPCAAQTHCLFAYFLDQLLHSWVLFLFLNHIVIVMGGGREIQRDFALRVIELYNKKSKVSEIAATFGKTIWWVYRFSVPETT